MGLPTITEKEVVVMLVVMAMAAVALDASSVDVRSILYRWAWPVFQ